MLGGLEFFLQGGDEVGGGAHGYRLSIPLVLNRWQRTEISGLHGRCRHSSCYPSTPQESHAMHPLTSRLCRHRCVPLRRERQLLWRCLAAGRAAVRRPVRRMQPATTTALPTSARCWGAAVCARRAEQPAVCRLGRGRAVALARLQLGAAADARNAARAGRLVLCRAGVHGGVFVASTTGSPTTPGWLWDRAGHGAGLCRAAGAGGVQARQRARAGIALAAAVLLLGPLSVQVLGAVGQPAAVGACCSSAAWC